ncbi:unnamed protein product [Protopolystoma xenopodis]|uniref:Uncharacterized protein n=1 Tax=Protopolystoma xenopodis TaxID=117903 RepID=A0A3S5CGQ1_9PLAT|nr:unnamed protein product [Protopolystoma xenopodis]
MLLMLDCLDTMGPWGGLCSLGPINDMNVTEGTRNSPDEFCQASRLEDQDILLAAEESEVKSEIDDDASMNSEAGSTEDLARAHATNWLVRSLRSGQVALLVWPLLADLLSPATVRLSLAAWHRECITAHTGKRIQQQTKQLSGKDMKFNNKVGSVGWADKASGGKIKGKFIN